MVWGSETMEYVSYLGIQNVGWIEEMRSDSAQGNFEISKWDFSADFGRFSAGFLSCLSVVYRWLKLAPSPKYSGV